MEANGSVLNWTKTAKPDCIFCQIVAGEASSHTVWEDETHVAFLSIFPNTKGTTVVIPKKHYPSYVFELPDDILHEFIIAVKKVAHLLDSKFDDVSRTALVFEGYGVDHVHAKLYPMHGTADMGEWRRIESKIDKYFEIYEGYISSHDHDRADDSQLSELAKKLRS
ncbi:HIT family protein [Patescibacteria group bacterium]|nr:HIT family protein [Patescibacteria group bacterium]